MTLDSQSLLPLLQENCPEASAYVVALSGGLDSCTLLALMNDISAQTHIPLRAIHIHHGLQSSADQWVEHCALICKELEIPLHTSYLKINFNKGDSLEAIAREQRYQEFETQLNQNEVLLVAQHQDDQSETLMLQLLRGAGPAGLAAMPVCRDFSKGKMLRPLLSFSREEIRDYALLHQLRWVEDPSNKDTRINRNYLRLEIMPQLRKRWPSASKTLSRSARLCAATNELTEDYAQSLLSEVIHKKTPLFAGHHTNTVLDVNLLEQYTHNQQAMVIRAWLKQLQLPVPGEAQMRQLLMQMFSENTESSPLVTWSDIEVRRYRNTLYAFKTQVPFDSTGVYQWNINKNVEITIQGYSLSAILSTGFGTFLGTLSQQVEKLDLDISFRNDISNQNENDKPLIDKKYKLKKLMQENGIPPWQRQRVPLLSCQGELIAIVGWWIAPKYQAGPDEKGYAIFWNKTA